MANYNAKGNPNWKKGVSGNPNGRPPKDVALTDILKGLLDIKDVEMEDENTGKDRIITRKEAVAERLILLALSGDLGAIKYIHDRIDGRPVETVNQTIKEIPEYVGFIDSRNTEDSDAN